MFYALFSYQKKIHIFCSQSYSLPESMSPVDALNDFITLSVEITGSLNPSNTDNYPKRNKDIKDKKPVNKPRQLHKPDGDSRGQSLLKHHPNYISD
jgi:hypothetical protein